MLDGWQQLKQECLRVFGRFGFYETNASSKTKAGTQKVFKIHLTDSQLCGFTARRKISKATLWQIYKEIGQAPYDSRKERNSFLLFSVLSRLPGAGAFVPLEFLCTKTYRVSFGLCLFKTHQISFCIYVSPFLYVKAYRASFWQRFRFLVWLSPGSRARLALDPGSQL